MTELQTQRLIIDADSHVMEPRTLWQEYLEPAYRDRAIRIEERNGVEHLIMGEQVVLAGSLAGLGGGHLEPSSLFGPTMKYEDGCPPGSYDPKARAEMYDALGISAGVVFPTIGILPYLGDDQDLRTAYCRAYNRWQIDFASQTPSRVLPIAHVNLADVDAACEELRYCLDHGFKGVFLPPEPVGPLKPSNAHFDKFWALVEEAGIPACLHVVVRFGGAGVPFEPWQKVGAGMLFGFSLGAPGQIIPTVTSMVLDGVFDRFPKLKLLAVEAGCGWAPYLMDRMDEKYDHFGKLAPQLRLKPSEYMQRNLWYVAEPNERTIGSVLDLVGQDRVLWGSDFPHIDSHPDAIDHITATIASLTPEQQDAVLGRNALKVFGL